MGTVMVHGVFSFGVVPSKLFIFWPAVVWGSTLLASPARNKSASDFVASHDKGSYVG